VNRTNLVPRLVVFLFTLVLTTFPVVAVAQAASAPTSARTTAGAAASPDLAAMALTQTDLADAGLDGFGLTYGWLGTLNDVANLIAEDRAGTAPANTEHYAQLLRETGWQRTYQSGLATPRSDDPSTFALRLRSDITQYADDDGATRSFAVWTDDGEITTHTVDVLSWDPEAGERPPVDEAVLWRYDGVQQSTGLPFHSLELHLRLANLTASVALDDFGREQPDVAAIDSLARALVRRIEAVLANEALGLSAAALRFAVPAEVPAYDNYARHDGQDVRFFGESVSAAKQRAASYPDAEDMYIVYETLPFGKPEATDDILFRSYVYQFANERDASAWMKTATEGVPLVADAPTFGDESYTCVCSDTPSATGPVPHGYGTVIRVGTRVALFDLYATWDISLDAFADVAHLQVRCLADGDCFQPASLPGSLLITATMQ
jgi:hypothetical protein